MKRPLPLLPNIEDDVAFTARLQPLATKILGNPEGPKIEPLNDQKGENPLLQFSEIPDSRTSIRSEHRIADVPDNRISDIPPKRISVGSGHSNTKRQAVAVRRDEIESKRGPKKRFEYVLPVRVGEALATDARNRGVSATTRLLQVLRKAGYPVIQEDLIDLRLERAGSD